MNLPPTRRPGEIPTNPDLHLHLHRRVRPTPLMPVPSFKKEAGRVTSANRRKRQNAIL
jgi:hypothetical protein